MINDEIAQEILHELVSSFEALETQSAAILQFLKDKGLASEEELAPYFEQAGNASNVKWRAVRVRIDHLLSSATKPAEETQPASSSKSDQGSDADRGKVTSREKAVEPPPKDEAEKETDAEDKIAVSEEREQKEEQERNASPADNRNQKERSKTPEKAANSDTSGDVPNRKTA